MTWRVVALFIHPVYGTKSFSVAGPCPGGLVGYVRHRDREEEDWFPDDLGTSLIDFHFHSRRFQRVDLFDSLSLCF